MKSTKKLTYSAILCALSVVIMYLGALTGILDITAVVIASLAVMFADFELRLPYNVMVYVATSVLSFFLLTNKQTALMYILFGGIYPIIKRYLCRINSKMLSIVARVFVFLFLMSGMLFITWKFFMLPEYDTAFKYLWILYPVAIIAFLIYDFVLEQIADWYFRKFRIRIKHLLK